MLDVHFQAALVLAAGLVTMLSSLHCIDQTLVLCKIAGDHVLKFSGIALIQLWCIVAFDALCIVVQSQRQPRRRAGITDRKVFARPESFCACLQNWPQKQKERFRTVWKDL